MSSIAPEFVERYQLELQKNPNSKVFAPLAEAYRKMGLVDEAIRICVRGVNLHPDFVSGRVAYAKALLEKKALKDALTQLEKAAQISPDNILAFTLLAETLMELRRPKDALKAYKMVLFLNPHDEKALQAVRKWEFLTADEYEAALFAMDNESQPPPLSKAATAAPLDETGKRALERALSLADAYTIRNDIEKALWVLKDARQHLGPVPDLVNRLAILSKRAQVFEEESLPQENTGLRGQKKVVLEGFLQRINDRRQR